MTSQIIAMLAASGFVLAGVTSTEATRSSSALPLAVMADGAMGGDCLVNVSRSAEGGVFHVTRQVLKDGRCVCNVSTGPSASNGGAEDQVSAILTSRSCADAPLVAEAAEGAAVGGVGSLLPILLGVGAVGGAAAAAGGGGGGVTSGLTGTSRG
ncbi:MAG: hypothetical protein ABIW31_03925 [Novosphingobium sp.]